MITTNFIILLTDGLLILAIIFVARLLSVSKSRSSWVMIALALLMLSLSQCIEFNLHTTHRENQWLLNIKLSLNLMAASLLAISVLRIGRLLRNIKKLDLRRIESEMRFKLLFDNSGDEIFLADFEGNIVEVNQEAIRRLGYSRSELMRKNFTDLKTPKYIPLVQKNIETILKQGQHVYVTEHVTCDGQVVFLEMSSRVIDYFGRKAILTIARDITERTEIERKISSAIIETEERERKRLAADLHDGLAPLLSTIKLYTDLLKKGKFTKISPAEAIESVESLVDDAIICTREISYNIMPSILQDFGLVAAINDFCEYLVKSNSINIQLDLDQYSIKPPHIEETLLFQSIKELINNSLKHSGASLITIFLENHGNQVNLLYKDNGKGFHAEEELNYPTGLGLNNIVNKIKSINGLTLVKSEKGNGMSVLITLKINDKNGNI